MNEVTFYTVENNYEYINYYNNSKGGNYSVISSRGNINCYRNKRIIFVFNESTRGGVKSKVCTYYAPGDASIVWVNIASLMDHIGKDHPALFTWMLFNQDLMK